ncbi:MAG: apolipoprotein N-acyltransferase, partial [Gammaproteobacteria bacterium]
MKFLSPIRQNKKRLIAATLYGALIPLSLAPFNLYPLSIISLLGLLHLWKNASAASAALSGWFFGLGMYGAGVSWIYVSIHDFAYTPVLISIITTLGFVGGLALLTAAQGFLYGRFNLHRASLLTFPALWVLFEWLRSWLLTGFPWLYLGYGMIDTPLSSFAPV